MPPLATRTRRAEEKIKRTHYQNRQDPTIFGNRRVCVHPFVHQSCNVFDMIDLQFERKAAATHHAQLALTAIIEEALGTGGVCKREFESRVLALAGAETGMKWACTFGPGVGWQSMQQFEVPCARHQALYEKKMRPVSMVA